MNDDVFGINRNEAGMDRFTAGGASDNRWQEPGIIHDACDLREMGLMSGTDYGPKHVDSFSPQK